MILIKILMYLVALAFAFMVFAGFYMLFNGHIIDGITCIIANLIFLLIYITE